jgi:hypothetical protein
MDSPIQNRFGQADAARGENEETQRMRPELQLALDQAKTLAVEDVPGFLADLEHVRVVALSVLMKPAPAPMDELLDVAECAARMHVGKDWLYRNSSKFKFARRIGRKLLFSSSGLDAFLRKQR